MNDRIGWEAVYPLYDGEARLRTFIWWLDLAESGLRPIADGGTRSGGPLSARQWVS
jgi:hypothetical protein